MKKSTELGSVNVYINFPDVEEEMLIATFKNKRYADIFLNRVNALKDPHDTFNFRAEVI